MTVCGVFGISLVVCVLCASLYFVCLCVVCLGFLSLCFVLCVCLTILPLESDHIILLCVRACWHRMGCMLCVDLRTARIRRSNNAAEDDGKDSQLDATEGTKAATKRKRPPKQNATEESTSKTESKSNTQQKSKPGSENKTATRSDRVVPGKSAAVRKPAAAKKQGDSVPKKKPAAAKPETPRKVMGGGMMRG